MSSFARHTTNVSRLGSCTMFSSWLVLVRDLKLEGICFVQPMAQAVGGGEDTSKDKVETTRERAVLLTPAGQRKEVPIEP